MPRDWAIELARSKHKFQEEMDQHQTACYQDFLASLGLDHTESVWDAFIEVWTAGYGWGQDEEYSYPS